MQLNVTMYKCHHNDVTLITISYLAKKKKRLNTFPSRYLPVFFGGGGYFNPPIPPSSNSACSGTVLNSLDKHSINFVFVVSISQYIVLLCPLCGHIVLDCLKTLYFRKLWIYTFLFLERVFASHSLC